jgi:Tfp pilus assembly protein PilF
LRRRLINENQICFDYHLLHSARLLCIQPKQNRKKQRTGSEVSVQYGIVLSQFEPDGSLSLDPDNYLALNALGLAYSIEGKFQESMKYFKDCLKINPALSEAHNNLGFVYNEMELYEQAEQEFLTATLDTQYSSRELPFYNLARLYLTQDRIEDALFQVQKSLEIKEDYLLALNLEGQILMKLDQVDKAIQSFEKARKDYPDDIDLNFNLAEAYFKKGQFQNAKQLFDSIYMKTMDPELKKRIENYLRQIK